MTLKKMMLLASMAFAAVAFMVPAVAQGDEWYTNNVKIGNSTNKGDTVALTGQLSSTLGKVRNGPCAVNATAILWNEKGVATGEATNVAVTGPCWLFIETTAGGPYVTECEIEKVTAKAGHVTTTGATAVSIAGVEFTNVYSAGCAAFGIPAEISAHGTLTGTWAAGGNAVSFAGGDLFTLPTPGQAITIDGSLSTVGLELK